MLLAVDIGNTNILFGVFKDDSLNSSFRLSSDRNRTAEQYCVEINSLSCFYNVNLNEVDSIIISSVVPSLTPLIKQATEMLTGNKPLVIGPGVKSGLKIKIDNPTQLGADLVANAVGAINKFPLPCLVVDLGTATKISVIDSAGFFRGCTISAGIGISLKALAASAALLPHIDLSAEEISAYGTNTVSSMQSGIIIGAAAMIDGLCERIENSLHESVKTIVATGGYSQAIVKHCKKRIIYDPNLILYGLNTIYKKNR